jgi:HSP20 family molecular chaperone IbpA
MMAGDHLSIFCHHDERKGAHGSITREVKRNYHLPDDVDPATVRSHLTMNGILLITADKKNKKGGR